MTDAAVLAADTAAYLDAAARRSGLTAVTTVGVITVRLARACRLLEPALARAGDWLGDEITAGRVTDGRPAAELVGLAREAGNLTTGCAATLAAALGAAHELVGDMIGPEPDFAAAVPYNDLDTIRAATLIVETADYLAAAVAGGAVTGPATLTGLTAALAAVLAAAVFRMPQTLAWAGDWLAVEVSAGRVISGRPLPELAAAAQDALETSAALAAQYARALQYARDLTAFLRPSGAAPGPLRLTRHGRLRALLRTGHGRAARSSAIELPPSTTRHCPVM